MMTALAHALNSVFLAPALLGFLGLIPIVVLLYLLKLRRTEVIVPSTLLWMKSLQDLTANVPFQRLRKNLLLLLQILVLMVLAAALARPFVRAERLRGMDLCLLIDSSASMQAREGDLTRLELAQAKAREMVEDLRGGDKMMVVSFADRAEVLCELTDDRFRLRSVIDSIQPADAPTRIRDAVLVAHSLIQSALGPRGQALLEMPAGTGANLHTIILSDGKIADLDELTTRDIPVSFLQVGSTTANAGIVAFSEREPPEGVAGRSPMSRQTFVLVHNEQDAPLETTLSLFFNDVLVAVEEVHAPAGGDSEVVFSHDELGQGVLRAELDCEDALSVDNTAWLVLRPAATVRVLVVSKGDSLSGYYLKRALMIEPRVELSAVTPENYTNSDEFDLIVFDNFAPETMPSGTLLFFNALPTVPGLEAIGTIERPPVLAKDPNHPVMRFLNPATVGIMKAHRLKLPPAARSLVSTEGAPLIADVSQGEQQILVVAFDLAQSNWPWHLSFPLFLQNVVTWVPRAALAQEQSVAAGRPLTLLPAPGREKASIIRPDGSKEDIDLDLARPTYYGRTNRAGVYEVNFGGGGESEVARFAVNLLDPEESAIRPAQALTFGRGELEAVQGRLRQNQELWWWFILIAVAILCLEWWIYSKRAWI